MMENQKVLHPKYLGPMLHGQLRSPNYLRCTEMTYIIDNTPSVTSNTYPTMLSNRCGTNHMDTSMIILIYLLFTWHIVC